MERTAWVIATNALRLGGLVNAAKDVASKVVIAAIGNDELAATAATFGADSVKQFVLADNDPSESAAFAVADAAAADSVDVVICGEGAASRVIAGMVSGKLDAAVVGSVVKLADAGDAITVTKEIANAKALEDAKVASKLVAIYCGPDAEAVGSSSPIEKVQCDGDGDKVVGMGEAGGSGLANALRVVGVGMGVVSKDDLAITDALANALGAEIACTLPACDNMHWYTADRVLGSSHNSAAPELYVAVGISGSPNHTSGVRDAKVIVSINNDENAEIFQHSRYGILGDLYKVVPALTQALS